VASIISRNKGTRQERHDVRYRDETGRHRSKTFKLKSQAKAFHARAAQVEERWRTIGTHRIDMGPSRDVPTLVEWVDDWLPRHRGKEGTVEESTRGKWRSAVNVGLRSNVAASMRLTAFGAAELQVVLDEVKAPSTRKTLHQALSLALDDAVAKRIITSNPARQVKVAASRRKRKPRAITDKHMAILLAQVPEPWRLLCDLQLWTGARPGEAIAWWPCDLVTRGDRDYLRIVRAVTKDGRGYKSVKTNEDGEREIPLPGDLASRLRKRVEDLGLESDAEQPLFPGRNLRRPVDRANFTKRVWNLAVDSAIEELRRNGRGTSGLEGVVWYDLRHTCVSRLIAKGADIVRVARWIGHTRPTTTLREYGHMFPQGLDELGELLAQ
jgi:integrase